MIQIEDFDSPIEAARKIIFGTRKTEMTPARRLGYTLAMGKAPENGGTFDEDMYSVSDIEEMAWYMLTYCKYHKKGADEE